MNRSFLVMCLLVAPWSGAFAWTDINLPGTWDGYNQSDPNGPWHLNKVSAPGTPAGQDWFTNTIHVAASGGDITAGAYLFDMVGNQNYGNKWSGPAAVNVDNTTTLGWQGGMNASLTVTNGAYYSFRVINPPGTNSAVIAVMKTTNPPVGVACTGQTPIAPLTNDTVTINILLSAAKSPEEHIYVRSSTDDFVTSTFFTEATSSSSPTNYAATIGPQTNGTIVTYYIFTSTVSLGGLNAGNVDSLTLNLDSHLGSNYTYSVNSMPWPGGATAGYPSDPATNIHHWKEEAVVGNGFMTCQLDQNGALYDMYYPSVGDRHSVSTSNEGYDGPEQFPACGATNQEANGQMNVIACQGGLGTYEGGTNNIHWLQNTVGTDYANVTQQWDSDSVNVVVTSNTLTAAGNNIQVVQVDFCPSTNALPLVTDGTRTNNGVYIKRFLVTNNQATTNTVDFYYDCNFNVNGGNGYDGMLWSNNTMIVYDNTYRLVAPNDSCSDDGYTVEYSPSFAFDWEKNISLYFGTVMKLVTNVVTGAGLPADGSWRDHTATDNQEGWIGKRLTLAPGQTNEVDVMIVGSWDDFAGATGTHNFWGIPMINWFYTNSMATAQAATETYWSNWLSAGVTVDLPDPRYNTLFKRSMLVTALHIDLATGSIIAGMHNGAYPFVWPRDGIYAAVTLDRTGHTNEAAAFYHWMRDIAFRDADCVDGGLGVFYQKYTTDGYKVWTSPQLDETASAPWGLYYHYLTTGDGNFLSNYWNLAFQCANASSEPSCSNATVYSAFGLMNGNNVWEDSFGLFIYSNSSIVRGLQEAANIALYVGSNSWATTFTNRASSIKSGIDARIDARVEPADISHLGLVVPYAVYTPDDPRMTNMVEWIYGRQASGSYQNSLIESDSVNYPDIVGLANRYIYNVESNSDTYWNTAPYPYGHSPWFLATSWYGEYFARWQDYTGGKAMINSNKYTLDLLINKLGPMGLGAEQITPTVALQKYPGFWLQTAWPNVWESHSTLVDQMMMFLDFKPSATNDTCYFAPKLPVGWSTMTFNNMLFENQRFNVTVTESSAALQTTTNVVASINKLTSGNLNFDIYLRVPTDQASNVSHVVEVNNTQGFVGNVPGYTTSLDASTGRVHVQGALAFGLQVNSIAVYPDTEGQGVPDYWKAQYGYSPSTPSSTVGSNGVPLIQSYVAGLNPNNPSDKFVVTQATQTASAQPFQVTLAGHAGRVYTLERTTNNLNGVVVWTDLPGPVTLTANQTVNLSDITPPTTSQAFYRVKVSWP